MSLLIHVCESESICYVIYLSKTLISAGHFYYNVAYI